MAEKKPILNVLKWILRIATLGLSYALEQCSCNCPTCEECEKKEKNNGKG